MSELRRNVIVIVAGMLLCLGFLMLQVGCKSYGTYTETFDMNGKVVSKTTTYEQDKLAGKGVAFGGSVSAMQLETDVSMSGGNPMPLPRVKMGFFTFFWIDAPMESGGYYFNQEKSLWSGNVASTTLVVFGSNQKGGNIKIQSVPVPIIDLGIVGISNPLVPNKVIITMPKPTTENEAK
jgi:hypothetical protein